MYVADERFEKILTSTVKELPSLLRKQLLYSVRRSDMGISIVRAVQRHKKKELEKTLKWIIYPPVIAGALLFGKLTKNVEKRKTVSLDCSSDEI